jgi:DNA-binding CsgD family transcriptional regulator
MRLREINGLVVNTSDPSFAVDGSGCIAAWNRAAEAMFALSACDAIGRQCDKIVQGTDECGPVCSAHCTVQQAVRRRHPVGNFDLQVQTANGMRWCNVSVLIADGENSPIPYSIHIVRQIDVGKRFELLVRDFVVTSTGLTAEQVTTLILSTRSCARETNLSTRERDVLKLLAKGVTTTAVAEKLHISRTTVNNHVQHILRKLDSHTRLEAIRRAEHAGLI